MECNWKTKCSSCGNQCKPVAVSISCADDVPIWKCANCGNVIASDISSYVYMRYRLISPSAPRYPYEQQAAIYLKEDHI